MTYSISRGDDYPIPAIISLNGEVVKTLGDDVTTFSYKNKDNTVRSIIGTPTAVDGEIEFFPEIGVDFQVVGTFEYDIQRVRNGRTYTHHIGKLLIGYDVTP